ncbi:MAG: N-acetylneuraminate synthase [Bacteroidetes bacterium]|nr:N-acetylneuraminate synthase [Bacteroidota bacterium]
MNTSSKTLIIAEAGVNHNGDIDKAFDLIDAAVEAGADVVKFQTFSADHLVTKTAQKAKYQKKTAATYKTQYEMLKALELERGSFLKLKEKCDSREIEFLTTGFDISDLEFISKIGLYRYKIPSGEITTLPYLRYLGKIDSPVILSTGMSTLVEIGDAIEVLQDAGTARSKIVILHCNTEYPTPMEDVNLQAMLTIKEEFGVEVGYSDHTHGIEIPIAAVAMGAIVIEKHFTLDRQLPGPDHLASLEPCELKSMVKGIRNIELAMGDGKKRPSNSEIKNISIARKSIVASIPIRTGDFFSPDNLTVKRPGSGISPMKWDYLIGKTSQRDYNVDDIIDADE